MTRNSNRPAGPDAAFFASAEYNKPGSTASLVPMPPEEYAAYLNSAAHARKVRTITITVRSA